MIIKQNPMITNEEDLKDLELKEDVLEAELVASGINISITGDEIDKIQSVTIYFKGEENE